MSSDSYVYSARVISSVLLGASLVSTIISSVVNLRQVRQFEDDFRPFRWNWGVSPGQSVLEDSISDMITYHAVFLAFALLLTPPLIYFCLRRSSSLYPLIVFTSLFTVTWFIKLLIYLNTDKLFYRWLAAFAPRAENVAHLLTGLSCICCVTLVLLIRRAKERQQY